MIALLVATLAFASPAPIASDVPTQPLVFAKLSLTNAQTQALANSPEVASARARVDETRAALAAARGGFAPSLVSSYAQVPQGNPPGPNIVSRQLTTGIQVALGDLVALAPAVREAAYTAQAASADELVAESTERIKVVGLYYDALKGRAIADARRSALTEAIALERAAQLRVRAGAAPRLDDVRAQVAVARAIADVETATAVDQNATDALRVETATADPLADASAGVPPPRTIALENPQPADVARSLRPELVSARRTADAARASIASARAAAFPTLTVSGGFLVGTDSGVPINAPAINAQLTLPLSGATHGRVAAASARAIAAQARALGIERQIALDVTASSRTLGAAERATQATTRARAAASRELAATELGYRNGASSSLEVTSARSTYVTALVDEVSARYDLAKARATFDIQVGR